MSKREDEYYKELYSSIKNEDDFKVAVKKEKRTVINIFNSILSTILLIVVVFAIVDGMYIRNNIVEVETCNGILSDESVESLFDLGLIERLENGTENNETRKISDEEYNKEV